MMEDEVTTLREKLLSLPQSEREQATPQRSGSEITWVRTPAPSAEHSPEPSLVKRARQGRETPSSPGGRARSTPEPPILKRHRLQGGSVSNAPSRQPAAPQKASRAQRVNGCRTRDAGDDVIGQRQERVCKDVDLGSVTTEEVAALIQTRVMGKGTDVEDAALVRLVRGFQAGSLEDWRAHLRELAGCRPLVAAEWIGSCDNLDKVEDSAMRLIQRHQVIGEMVDNEVGSAYIAGAIQVIEILKFAMDWNGTRGEGSKRGKTQFYIRAFQNCPPYAEAYRTLGDKERRTVLEEHKNAFATWKKRNEIVVTARNRLLTLYNAFGCAVIVDPFWRLDSMGNRCSRSFTAVVERVYARMCDESEDPASTLKEHNKVAYTALKRIFTVVHSQQLAAKIGNFVKDHEPTFALDW
ncbi:uncharacterized protein PHACADRAFT_121833 [Phanerochaete carnosa HHB-10118-sp]|uniref:Uncharacterized protein n=1 Tax=Phanerochaete carnosa (strain HHB-10118-sp) TaxID=650164 RepID=K5WZF7_PHACS|nr:uncharacterized protein PHACADRAFT_121833 [Phanerochaete carnosa HHB-10118-sp]EKM55872.1 hypothetical protein PHACADRAFT_121833 [Phanerochaete carnosa HHB-10118-sp]